MPTRICSVRRNAHRTPMIRRQRGQERSPGQYPAQ